MLVTPLRINNQTLSTLSRRGCMCPGHREQQFRAAQRLCVGGKKLPLL